MEEARTGGSKVDQDHPRKSHKQFSLDQSEFVQRNALGFMVVQIRARTLYLYPHRSSERPGPLVLALLGKSHGPLISHLPFKLTD